jgi:hypothetical protein
VIFKKTIFDLRRIRHFMFADARVDGFHAIIRRKTASMIHRLRSIPNSVLKMIASRFNCPIPIQQHWIGIITGRVPVSNVKGIYRASHGYATWRESTLKTVEHGYMVEPGIEPVT